MRANVFRFPPESGEAFLAWLRRRSLSSREIVIPVRVGRSLMRGLMTFYAKCSLRREQGESELTYRLVLPWWGWIPVLLILLFGVGVTVVRVIWPLPGRAEIPLAWAACLVLLLLEIGNIRWQYRECLARFERSLADWLGKQSAADSGPVGTL